VAVIFGEVKANNPKQGFIGAEILGRYEFLMALRRRLRPFWIAIHAFWQAGDMNGLQQWMSTNDIVDHWFVEVVWETVAYWSHNPESPSARLDEEDKWFCYGSLVKEELNVKLFCPVISHPTLKNNVLMDRPKAETVDEFETRMRTEFDAQLRDYTGWLRRVLGENLAAQETHAEWTAFAFSGCSFADIAEKWPGLARAKGCYQPDKTVSMAVRRFAARIGLTLPKRRNRR
jgi:hypothetical protein